MLAMNPLDDNRLHITRRALFGRAASGIGAAALARLLNFDLLGGDAAVAAEVGRPTFSKPVAAFGGLAGLPHFPPKAKRVIYLFQNGAPSHVDLFDYKPMLKKWYGKEIPPEIQGG